MPEIPDLDELLLFRRAKEWYAGEEFKEMYEWGKWEQSEHKGTHLETKTPDNRVFSMCIYCGNNIAKVSEVKGRRVFEILLNGKKRNDGNWQENTGGKCRNAKCGKSHTFYLEEIARLLGHITAADLLRADGIDPESSTPEAQGKYIIWHYVVRADGRWQGHPYDEEDPFCDDNGDIIDATKGLTRLPG